MVTRKALYGFRSRVGILAVGKDDTTGFLVFAIGLAAVSGGINEIPVLGGHVGSILGNVSALVNAAAVVVVIRCVVSMTGLGGGGDGDAGFVFAPAQ